VQAQAQAQQAQATNKDELCRMLDAGCWMLAIHSSGQQQPNRLASNTYIQDETTSCKNLKR